jgi:hypothetical protein
VPHPLESRPPPDEYAPYYGGYIATLPAGDVRPILRAEAARLAALIARSGAGFGDHRYAPGKWSVKEVVGHIADTERILTYRLLRFARGDRTELPGFDENAYAAADGVAGRSMDDVLADAIAVRAATLTLLDGLPAAAFGRDGTANGVRFTVRALACIAAGHARHHANILEERYLAKPT